MPRHCACRAESALGVLLLDQAAEVTIAADTDDIQDSA
jgi:hypothetical protein